MYIEECVLDKASEKIQTLALAVLFLVAFVALDLQHNPEDSDEMIYTALAVVIVSVAYITARIVWGQAKKLVRWTLTSKNKEVLPTSFLFEYRALAKNPS